MADPTPTPPSDPQPSDPPPPVPAPADPAAKTPPWGDPANFDAEKAWELIQNLRTEKGDPTKVADLEQQIADLKDAQQGQLDGIAKALGLKPDDTPPDPAKLAAEIEAEQGKTAAAETRANAAERQLAVFKAAVDHGANPVALLDSTSFLESIKDIPPGDAEKVGEAIAAAVEKNPLFKASPTPNTPPFPGGPRPSAPARAGSLGEAIANKLADSRSS